MKKVILNSDYQLSVEESKLRSSGKIVMAFDKHEELYYYIICEERNVKYAAELLINHLQESYRKDSEELKHVYLEGLEINNRFINTLQEELKSFYEKRNKGNLG